MKNLGRAVVVVAALAFAGWMFAIGVQSAAWVALIAGLLMASDAS